tara:strand:- start:471 stop:1133 length:663 start_codon:yes stop_codon:yes gene_type:complete
MSSNKDYEFNEKIHSILLNPYLSKESFQINIDLIKKYNIKNISTSLNFLSYIKDIFPLSNIKINTLISYPFGDLPNKFVQELILYAKDAGSQGIEYTPKFFTLSNNNEEEFAKDIENISKLDLPITLIFNKRQLSDEVFSKAINISLELGIANFQFGDGFGQYLGIKEIKNIAKLLGKNNFIKIVGGIKTISDVKETLDAGADCIGTSYYHNIFQELKSQ